jgi:RNA-directed DNA polymerase
MKKTPRLEGWYVRKYFPHFDRPLEFEVAKRLVEDENWVSKHAFWPFLGFEDRKRRFRTVDGERIADTKSRPIKYCSHVDGYVFAYYANQLQAAFERYIGGKDFATSVIGYRRGIGTNIDMARAAFAEVARRRRAAAICLDISSFFDNIDHRLLKRNIELVLGVARLSPSWFSVYRAMTRYSWVDAEQLRKTLEIDPASPPRPLCSASDFRRRVRGDGGGFPRLIATNNEQYGIPQGSPISAVFSNVFMLGFDEALQAYVSKLGGSYRRYSDDIMIICAPRYRDRVVRFLQRELKSLGGEIRLSEDKTEVSIFQRRRNVTECDRPITYLGFTFDGRRVLLRGRTLSRYYRRMSYAARHAASKARDENAATVFKRKLYREFTHLGSDNFYSYAKRSARVLSDQTPKLQLRRHFDILRRKVGNKGR